MLFLFENLLTYNFYLQNSISSNFSLFIVLTLLLWLLYANLSLSLKTLPSLLQILTKPYLKPILSPKSSFVGVKYLFSSVTFLNKMHNVLLMQLASFQSMTTFGVQLHLFLVLQVLILGHWTKTNFCLILHEKKLRAS